MRRLKLTIHVAMYLAVFIVFVGCHNYNKNEIIKPLEEYENYMIEAMQDRIAITGVAYSKDDYVTFTIVLLSDENEYQIVEEYLEQSTLFLDSNPNCILNDGYAITYNFNKRNNSNGSSGEPICRLSNVGSGEEVKDHIVMADLCMCPDHELYELNNIEEVICSGYSDEQIDYVVNLFPNLRIVYVESQTRAAELDNDFPDIEIIGF